MEECATSDVSSPSTGTSSIHSMLGYCVCLAGTFYKLPQVIQIHNARSAGGISATMVGIDAYSVLVDVAYSAARGLPVSAWGELPSQFLCSSIIFMQCMIYQRKLRSRSVAALSVVWCAIAIAVLKLPEIVGKTRGRALLEKLKSTNVIVTCLGKVPQILVNVRNGSSGELSLTTTSLALLGNVVRIFTGYKFGVKMISSQLCSGVLNASLVAQIIAYRK